MFRGMRSILYKEFIHLRRDPFSLFLMLMVPMIQMTIFGYAIDMDVKDISTGIVDLCRTSDSRDIISALKNSGYFKVEYSTTDSRELESLIVSGKIRVGVIIPADFSRNLEGNRSAAVQVLIDGSDSTPAMNALNVTSSVGLIKSMERLLPRTGWTSTEPPVEMRQRILFNPTMRSANFMVPGLAGIVMQVITVFLTAFSIVREREQGTLEQLMVTPVTRLGLMIGKILPYSLVGFVETCTVLLVMHYIFLVPITGSLVLLLSLAVLFLFSALGLGLFISTVATTQIQALMLSFFTILPSVLLSGFMFPRSSMPEIIQWMSTLIPVTYFIEILRGIIIRGAGFYELLPNILALAIFGIVLIWFSSLRFQKRLG